MAVTFSEMKLPRPPRRDIALLASGVALALLAVACNDASRATPTALPPTLTPMATPPFSTATATPHSSLASPLCEPDVGQDGVPFTERVREIQLGFRATHPGVSTAVPVESLMVAGDLNIVDVNTVVEYSVKDLDAFVSTVADPEGCPDGRTLRDAARAALSQVVGQHAMDDVLTVGRQEMQADTKVLLQQILDSYGAGINIEAVLLQEVRPPEQVLDAYHDVDRARQDMETTIAQAQAYQEDIIPRARGEAQRIVDAAKTSSALRLIQAEDEAGRFVSILREYAREEEEAFRRLYLRSMEEILPGVDEFITAVEDAVSSPKAGLPLSGGLFPSSHASRAVPALNGHAGSAVANTRLAAGPPGQDSDAAFDHRLLLVDTPPGSFLDRDKQFLEIDTHIRYRITDEVKFLERLGTLNQATDTIVGVVLSHLREAIATRPMEDVIGASVEVTAEAERVVVGTSTRQEILDRVVAAAAATVKSPENDFGVEIVDVRMKRVGFPEAVRENIFNRMRAERERISMGFRAQGEEGALKIRATVDGERAVILSEAQSRVAAIEAEGEAKALDVFIRAVARFPELSRYQKSLEDYKASRGLTHR